MMQRKYFSHEERLEARKNSYKTVTERWRLALAISLVRKIRNSDLEEEELAKSVLEDYRILLKD